MIAPSALVPFDFEGQEIRTDEIDGSTWMCAQDVGRCLGLKRNGTQAAIGRLDPTDRADVVLSNVSSNGTTQNRSMTFVSQSGALDMALDSNKPEARRFRRWLTHEVVPSIAKTGRYELEPQTLEQRSLALIGELSEVVDRQKAEIAAQAEKIAEDEPGVLWFQEQDSAQGLWTTAEVVGDSDTSVLLGESLWAALDEVFFYTPKRGRGEPQKPKRRFRRRFVADGVGVNLLQTCDNGGHRITAITPKWTAGKGTATLKFWLRQNESQLRIGNPAKALVKRPVDRQRRLPEGTVR